MHCRCLLGAFAVSALFGTCATAQEADEIKARSARFDDSPLTAQVEIAQAQQVAVEKKAPGVVAAEAAGPDQAALAKAAQNPIASMISIPFQWNATPGTQWAPNSVDPDANHDKVMNVVNVQPVFPFKLNDDWTLVTRTIVPFINTPFAKPTFDLTPTGEPYFGGWREKYTLGVGDINPTGFFVPTLEGDFTIGFGPTLSAPISDAPLSSGKWTAGPALVGVYTKGPWVVGGLVNNMWSFAGDDDRKDVNKMLIQPFVNYNLPKGWYISFSPIITADWENEDNGWTLPVGAGVGRVFKLGKQPLNVSFHAYYNAVKPEIGGEELMGDWTIRTQVQFLIPTAK
ncbi:MAG: neuromedin U [Cyanobacteriota bacterium]|nr:neuromedin U [Cyanobacteriota bacterium]